MKTRYASLIAAAITLLLATASTQAQTVLANGLRNTELGFVGLQVTEPQWVLPYGYWSPANHAIIEISGLTSLGLEGVEVELGHSRGGAFFYPWAEAQPGYFMSALSFGRVDGEPGRYLAAIGGRREQEWGNFTAWSDFSPLCLGPYRYRFYSYGGLQQEIVSWEREIHFLGAYYAPRVNPCAIDADGQIKAVIDFQNSYAEVHIGDVTAGVTRLEILPTVHHRPIDFATSVQIRGGGGLNSFGLYQVEPFAFGFSHYIVGGGTARLEVEPSRARLRRASDSSNMLLGTWVETPDASHTDLQFEPLFASSNDVQILLEGIGFGPFGQGSYVGQALLTLRTNGASLWGRLDICTNQQAVAFRDGVELGLTPYSTNAASLEVEEPVGLRAASVLAHTTNTLAALRFVFDRAAPVIFPDGRRFEADEVRVRAGAAATLEHVRRTGLTASNLTVVTITNELAGPAQIPALTIETVGRQVHISWPDPNRVYYLQCSTGDPANEWVNIPDRPLLMNGIATVILPKSETEHRFYRLYLGTSWDRPPGRD